MSRKVRRQRRSVGSIGAAAGAQAAADASRAMLLACQRALRTLLAPEAPLATVAFSSYRVEHLERRVLLAYSPGGDGVFGTLNLGATTLAHNDRIVMDLAATTSNGLQYDVVNITGAVTLGGLLDLNAMNLSNLQAGNRLDLLQVSIGGSLSGAFHAVKGLAATAGLDFAVVQGPAGISLVATSLPTGDFTFAVDSTSEFNNLVSFLQSGSGSASLSQDSIHFLGQRIAGNMTISAGSGTMDISLLSNANASQTGRVMLNGASMNYYEVYGGAEFKVGARGGSTSGLRLESFTSSGYTLASSLGGTGAPATNLANGTLGPLTLEAANGGLSRLVLDAQQVDATASFDAISATLAFTKSNGSAPDGGQNPGGMTAKADYPAGGVSFRSSYNTSWRTVRPGAVDC